MGHVERKEELSMFGSVDFRIELEQYGGFSGSAKPSERYPSDF
jgi:hypothetical protein